MLSPCMLSDLQGVKMDYKKNLLLRKKNSRFEINQLAYFYKTYVTIGVGNNKGTKLLGSYF